MSEVEQLRKVSKQVGRLEGLTAAFEIARTVHSAATTRESIDCAFAISQAIFRRIEDEARRE